MQRIPFLEKTNYSIAEASDSRLKLKEQVDIMETKISSVMKLVRLQQDYAQEQDDSYAEIQNEISKIQNKDKVIYDLSKRITELEDKTGDNTKLQGQIKFLETKISNLEEKISRKLIASETEESPNQASVNMEQIQNSISAQIQDESLRIMNQFKDLLQQSKNTTDSRFELVNSSIEQLTAMPTNDTKDRSYSDRNVTYKEFKALQKIVDKEIRQRENSYMEVSEVAWDAKRACKQIEAETSTGTAKLIRKVSVLEQNQSYSHAPSNADRTVGSTDRTQRRQSLPFQNASGKKSISPIKAVKMTRHASAKIRTTKASKKKIQPLLKVQTSKPETPRFISKKSKKGFSKNK